MHIVLVGGGVVGYSLAKALSINHSVVVIDHNPDVAGKFESLDVEFIVASGTADATLRRAGAERAEVVVACTGVDEVNIVACGMTSQLGAPRTICFVSRDDLLNLPAETHGRFGVTRVVWPEAQLAADIERIVSAPGAIDAEVFAGGAVQLLEYRLGPESPLTAGPVASLHLPHSVLVVAVRRGDSFFIPRGETTLTTGDKVVVMGTPDAMRDLQGRLTPTKAGGHQVVTIIGGGDVGLRLAERLETVPSMELRIIERDRRRGEMLAARLRRALVLNGDGTDLELLETEDIGRSDVLVSVIDNDERNLLASMLGRQLGARRIITRVSKPANLRLFERVGIDVAISARGAAVASVLDEIEGGPALLAVLEQGEGRILELEVPAQYGGRALSDLEPPRDSIVGAILRNGAAIVPRGTDLIEAGDHLIVFSTRDSADKVRAFFRPGS